MKVIILRIFGLSLMGAALYQTFDFKHSTSEPDRWIIDVTLEPSILGLFVAAVAMFWIGSRFANRRGSSTERMQYMDSGVPGRPDDNAD